MSDEYQEYVKHQQTLYDVEEDVTDSKKLAQLQGVYEQLQKDYQTLRQEIVYEKTLREQAEKNCHVAEKTLDQVIELNERKQEYAKELTIEVPCKTLYGLAFNWQYKPGSVFVVVDRETGNVKLLTPQEFEATLPDPITGGPRKPNYRHWWAVQVCDVKAGQNIEGGYNF